MSAADVEFWRGWYEYEPRGSERADYQTAFLAHYILAAQGGKNTPSISDCLESLRMLWADGGEFQKAIERRKMKAARKEKKKLELMVELMKASPNGNQHRQMEHPDKS